MKFEEYRKAFYAGVAGFTIAGMGILQNVPDDARVIAAALSAGFATGFLAAFLPANTVQGVNPQAEAKKAATTP